MDKMNHRKTGLQNRDSRGLDQDIRLSWQKDDGRFEWALQDNTIELVDAYEFKARGGRIVSEGWDDSVGVKVIKEAIYGYQ